MDFVHLVQDITYLHGPSYMVLILEEELIQGEIRYNVMLRAAMTSQRLWRHYCCVVVSVAIILRIILLIMMMYLRHVCLRMVFAAYTNGAQREGTGSKVSGGS